MNDEATQLSNPFSTGGGGTHFENQVQSAFVVLMLTGGAVPCLRPWPIRKIKLQGKYEGYNTDDFIAFVEERTGGSKAKFLAQIKHSVAITEGNSTFSEVIQAAWSDFQNADCFDPRTDVIALITGPLSAHDIENARIILERARHSENSAEFLKKISLAKFSSNEQREKLDAFRSQLRKANAGKLAGPEKSALDDADVAFHQAEYERLGGELQAAHDASRLPEVPSEDTRAALNDLLVRIRLSR